MAIENKAVEKGKRRKGMEILWFVGIIAAWIVLQAVILPKLGIST